MGNQAQAKTEPAKRILNIHKGQAPLPFKVNITEDEYEILQKMFCIGRNSVTRDSAQAAQRINDYWKMVYGHAMSAMASFGEGWVGVRKTDTYEYKNICKNRDYTKIKPTDTEYAEVHRVDWECDLLFEGGNEQTSVCWDENGHLKIMKCGPGPNRMEVTEIKLLTPLGHKEIIQRKNACEFGYASKTFRSSADTTLPNIWNRTFGGAKTQYAPKGSDKWVYFIPTETGRSRQIGARQR